MRALMLSTCITLLLAAPAAAQEITPAVEVSAGYSALSGRDDTWSGWVASGSVSVTRWFAVAVDAGGNYFTRTYRFMGEEFRVDGSRYGYAAGPRFVIRGSRASAFVQPLVGIEHRSGINYFILQPGGGVDIWLSRRLGFRAGGDVRTLYDEEEWYTDSRVHAGVVVALGAR